jgi:hypothetical protein
MVLAERNKLFINRRGSCTEEIDIPEEIEK